MSNVVVFTAVTVVFISAPMIRFLSWRGGSQLQFIATLVNSATTGFKPEPLARKASMLTTTP